MSTVRLPISPSTSRALPEGLRRPILALLSVLVLGGAMQARADEDEHHERRAAVNRQTAQPAVYAQECGSCHLAFPARYLPAESWHHLMGGLDRHFGVDASLDAAQARTITTWLEQNAAVGRRLGEAPPQDRITRSRWFVRQHDEIGAAVWKRASVHSPANCAACHSGAAQGDFNEDAVRIPR